jgi:predicted RNA polymerase sigma factor
VAVAMAWGAQVGLEMLLRLESQADSDYPYHAARRFAAVDGSVRGYHRCLQA